MTKTISSAPEGGARLSEDGPGYVTESEAVSDLIGTTALIANTPLSWRGQGVLEPRTEDFNGSFCRIEAFDPQVWA